MDGWLRPVQLKNLVMRLNREMPWNDEDDSPSVGTLGPNSLPIGAV